MPAFQRVFFFSNFLNHAFSYKVKKGSPSLRKTLFQIMDGLIKRSPADDPVYAFMDKKRSEGKPYYVYMTAGANKFLRIYYGRVREYLASLEESKES